MTENKDTEMLAEYDRFFYRSSLVSMFWAVIQARKKRKSAFKMKQLSDALKVDKSVVSRWFANSPNWTANTVSDIANALDLEIRVSVYDRTDGKIYTPSGEQTQALTTSCPSTIDETPRINTASTFNGPRVFAS
ncbi:helix-turn-helix transcriptional regulator [Sphingorhabdus sp. EL138]|uniref:helix-turn-helix domain-containing protein n=1 Tax=Sphingorhabdus sp. EL138 TaxID=2073156 RepID=UPI0025EB8478|nr:helix-turn-helix transcriptional regulator [Sphingorhabdus sp. EL138]